MILDRVNAPSCIVAAGQANQGVEISLNDKSAVIQAKQD